MLRNFILGLSVTSLSGAALATPEVTATLSGDCTTIQAGKELQVKPRLDGNGRPIQGVFDVVGNFGQSMRARAKAGESISKDCIIDWSLRVPSGFKFKRLDLEANGTAQIRDKGSAYASIEHIVDFNHDTYDDVNFDSSWGDKGLISWDFRGGLSGSQMGAIGRKCGATIPMNTYITIDALSDSDSRSITTMDLKHIQTDVNSVKICSIRLERC